MRDAKVLVKCYKGSEILSYLKANKITRYSFVGADRKHSWVKDRQFISHNNKSSQSISIYVLASKLQFSQSGKKRAR